jgi:hypothetical protein
LGSFHHGEESQRNLARYAPGLFSGLADVAAHPVTAVGTPAAPVGDVIMNAGAINDGVQQVPHTPIHHQNRKHSTTMIAEAKQPVMKPPEKPGWPMPYQVANRCRRVGVGSAR